MNLFENQRISVRRFVPDDWNDIFEIALSNLSSEFVDPCEMWPAEKGAIKDITNYISGKDGIYAVFAKDVNRVVAFVKLSHITDGKYLDIGYISNLNYAGRDYEYEGLKFLCDHAFRSMDISGIRACCQKSDKARLEILRKLGMKVTAVYKKIHGDKDFAFEKCELKAHKEEYMLSLK